MSVETEEKVQAFFNQYPKRMYPKNQIIIFAGDTPQNIYFIISGKVAYYDISYRGDEVVINIYKPPAFFPMSQAINKTSSRYFYKAEEDTIVRIAPPDEVVAMIKSEPDIMFDLLAQVYGDMDGVLERTVHLLNGSARSRVMYELLIECRRFGKKLEANQYSIALNEGDLASRTGLARETVNREIKHLKDRNIMQIEKGGHIVVRDLRKLEQQLGQMA